MIKALLFSAFAALALATPAVAEDRFPMGTARMFSNDFIGDGHDRWRTGAYFVSRINAPSWEGQLPSKIGSVLEYRLRTEIVAPEDLVSPKRADRRYAGIMAAGVYTHFALGRSEATVGAELVVTGSQTGVGAFQRAAHNVLNLPTPQVLGEQISNAVHPTLRAELGRSFGLGDRVTLRPFVEAQAGIESFVRVGGDVVIGHFGQGALLVRDTVTGQRTEGIAGTDGAGLSLTLGGDMAHMFDSALLPSGGRAVMLDERSRVRLGLNWQGEKSEVFYGVTWLSEEVESQTEGQLVGSLRLRLKF